MNNHLFLQRRERLMDLKNLRENKSTRRAVKAVAGKCPGCSAAVPAAELAKNLYVCPQCGRHHTIGAYLRLSLLLDPGSFRELDERLASPNVLDFPGYDDKLKAVRRSTGLTEAVVSARGRIEGHECVITVLDSRFLMGSMGQVVGERITRLFERATEEKLPVVLFCCSGGARMQEGIHSLMQMAKTAQAVRRHSEAGLLYVSVLTDPTTGGVMASFAMLGDVILAEPGALIGFAGPRVIEQTIRQKLPEGFQTSEFLLEHGFVDRIVKRGQYRKTLQMLIRSAQWKTV